MIEVIYPNDDDPRKEIETTPESVDRTLMENTRNGEVIPTLEAIAEQMGITRKDLEEWSITDADYLNGLKKFKSIQEEGIFEDFNNRADVTVLAMLLSETRNRHNP